MELLSIDDINDKYFLYNNIRSLRNWLYTNSVKVIRLGRKQYVSKTDFEILLNKMFGKENPAEKETEQKITTECKKVVDNRNQKYTRLLNKMSEVC